ncbi:MAG: hypothetical protein ACPGVB_11135 [Chitinophagales bacterium]
MKSKVYWFMVSTSLVILFCSLNSCTKRQSSNRINIDDVVIKFSDYYKRFDYEKIDFRDTSLVIFSTSKTTYHYYLNDEDVYFPEDLEKIKGYWNDLYRDGISESVGF